MNKEWKYFISHGNHMYRYKLIFINNYVIMETYDSYSKKWEEFYHNMPLHIIERFPVATKLDIFKHLNSNKLRG